MTLSWSEYFSRWFLAVVVWHSGPWRTIYLSATEGSTTIGCLQVDPEVSANCCEGQWFHVISKKYYNGCYNTNPSDMLQLNSTVSCFGGQTGTSSGSPSPSCSGRALQICKENATLPVSYNGNNISVVVENECIEESDNHNVCADLSDTVTGPLYLASPSLFIARVPSTRTKCRCEVHAESFLQMEILFADVSVSRFTISCGQWNISEHSFSTNLTNWMVPIPQDSSDCVLEVDESFNGNTSYPVHKVWIKITVLSGSSLTFRCNNDTSSSSLTPPKTETSKADDSRSSLAPSSSSSSQTSAATTFVTVTLSSQTSSLQTQQDTISTSFLTTFQAYSNTSDVGQDADNRAYILRIIYIVVGVASGILIIIIVIVVVVLLRTWFLYKHYCDGVAITQTTGPPKAANAHSYKGCGGVSDYMLTASDLKKRRTLKYRSKTEAASDEKLTEAPGETGFINYEGVDLEENIQQPRRSHSVDNRRTFQEKHPASGIQGQDDKQGILIENVAYQSLDDELAPLHDDVTGRKHKKTNPHDGFSKLPETTIQSTPVKKQLEDRDDASDDDGMVMFDNVAYESFGSLAAENTSDRTSKELDSSETDPPVPKPESKLRTTNSDAKQPLPLPAGNDVWTKIQEDIGDDEDDVANMIINDTYVSAGRGPRESNSSV